MLNTYKKYASSFAFIETLSSFKDNFGVNYEEIKLHSFLSSVTKVVHFTKCVTLSNEIFMRQSPVSLGLVKIKDLTEYEKCFLCCKENTLVFLHEDDKFLDLETVTNFSQSTFNFTQLSLVLAFVNFEVTAPETTNDAISLLTRTQFLTSEVFLKVKTSSGFEALTEMVFEKVKEIRSMLASLKENTKFLEDFNTVFKDKLVLDFTNTHYLITEEKMISEMLHEVSEIIAKKVDSVTTHYICAMTAKEFKEFLASNKKVLTFEDELLLLTYQFSNNFFVLPYAVYEHIFRTCFEDSIPATFVVDSIPSQEVFDTATVFFDDMKHSEYIMDEELKEIFERALNLE